METAPATVVLVHGLWMHGSVFCVLRRRLARAGLTTRAWSYRSVRRDLAANEQALADFLDGIDAASLHLVGHSLGGLVILSALARRPDPRVRRVVLMGPPYRGSRTARDLLRIPGMSRIIGRSMQDWLATPPPVVAGIDIGVIAGNRCLGLAGPLVGLPQPNDGIVMVDETRVDAARDSIALHVSHTEMLFSRACAEQVAHFLQYGSFVHTTAGQPRP